MHLSERATPTRPAAGKSNRESQFHATSLADIGDYCICQSLLQFFEKKSKSVSYRRVSKDETLDSCEVGPDICITIA